MMEAIWSDVAVSDESLVQCIADIRRVIGKDARKIVERVPREGYRMHLQTQKSLTRNSFLLLSLRRFPFGSFGQVRLSSSHP